MTTSKVDEALSTLQHGGFGDVASNLRTALTMPDSFTAGFLARCMRESGFTVSERAVRRWRVSNGITSGSRSAPI